MKGSGGDDEKADAIFHHVLKLASICSGVKASHPELALCRFALAFARLDLLRIRIAPTPKYVPTMISHRKFAFAR